MVEHGYAVLQANGLDWVYTATVTNGAVTGSKVRAVAKDLLGNEMVSEVIVNTEGASLIAKRLLFVQK